MSCLVYSVRQRIAFSSMCNLYSLHSRTVTSSSAPTTSATVRSKTFAPLSPLPTIPPINGLQNLPNRILFRSLAVLSVASLPQPVLTKVIAAVKKYSATVESNLFLRRITRATFYDTFCIGETKAEIVKNFDELRLMGIRGVVLAFAREASSSKSAVSSPTLHAGEPALRAWVQFNLRTIEKLKAGDYLAVRCTGAGNSVLKCMDDFYALVQGVGYDQALKQAAREIDVFSSAMHEICAAAQQSGIKVLVDAEDIRRQTLIDHIGLELMSSYNQDGRAVVLNTYQMYLKTGLEKLKAHLEHSAKHGYTLGVKLVRGAYISTEPNRNQIHDTKGATDKAYDRAVSLLISGPERTTSAETSNETLAITTAGPWTAEVMLATHNTHSAREALRLYKDTIIRDKGNGMLQHVGLQSLVFAQLKGMADELSFELTAHIKSLISETNEESTGELIDTWDYFPKIGVYKYSVWGTFQECLLYLLRRAEENQDAASRSRATALAMVKELLMRLNPLKRA